MCLRDKCEQEKPDETAHARTGRAIYYSTINSTRVTVPNGFVRGYTSPWSDCAEECIGPNHIYMPGSQRYVFSHFGLYVLHYPKRAYANI